MIENNDKGVNKSVINWFPGHMAKAIREIKEKINLVDFIIEVCDARAPISSSNPIIQELSKNKFYLKILSKVDLSDEMANIQYQKKFKDEKIPYLYLDLNNKNSDKPIIDKIKEISKPLKEKDLKKGLKPRNVRVMIVGIPNVGKSTLINLLAKRKSAAVGNIPGFTKSLKLVRCNGFDLLDTPGILWPDLSQNNIGLKLALIGAIKTEILPNAELVKIALEFLNKNYPNCLYSKYQIKYNNIEEYLESFAKKMGHLLKNNEVDLQRSILTILNDFKNGRICQLTIENLEV